MGDDGCRSSGWNPCVYPPVAPARGCYPTAPQGRCYYPVPVRPRPIIRPVAPPVSRLDEIGTVDTVAGGFTASYTAYILVGIAFLVFIIIWTMDVLSPPPKK
jgi:hypothetical protein